MQKLTFGDVPAETREATCAFQVMDVARDGRVTSSPCKERPLANGWCAEHQHAQRGMDIGERLRWQSVEIPMTAEFRDNGISPFTLIIGQGKMGWLAYFERATGPGLATVMKYLEKKVERE